MEKSHFANDKTPLRPPSFRPERRNFTPHWHMKHSGRRSLDSAFHECQGLYHPYRRAAPLEMTVLASSIQSFQKGTNPIPVISTGVERSGEISPLMVRVALRREISRLRVSWVPGSLPSISARSSARDDHGGSTPSSRPEPPHFTPPMTKRRPHLRHFDESEAEWRNLPL